MLVTLFLWLGPDCRAEDGHTSLGTWLTEERRRFLCDVIPSQWTNDGQFWSTAPGTSCRSAFDSDLSSQALDLFNALRSADVVTSDFGVPTMVTHGATNSQGFLIKGTVKRAELSPGAPPGGQQRYVMYTAGLGHSPTGGHHNGPRYLGSKELQGGWPKLANWTRDIPRDGSHAAEITKPIAVLLYGVTRRNVLVRLAEELSPLRIESDPLLAVRMTVEGEWGIMKPTAMESMWQEWLSRKRIADPYVSAKAAGLTKETMRLLTYGEHAPYFFVAAEMCALFNKFIVEEKLSSYVVAHLTAPGYR